MGTRQSGVLDLKLANLASDGKVLAYARNSVIEMLEEDPDLTLPKNECVAIRARQTIFRKPNWSIIS
jgi:ATP-dependent DNA helicase RecG